MADDDPKLHDWTEPDKNVLPEGNGHPLSTKPIVDQATEDYSWLRLNARACNVQTNSSRSLRFRVADGL